MTIVIICNLQDILTNSIVVIYKKEILSISNLQDILTNSHINVNISLKLYNNVEINNFFYNVTHNLERREYIIKKYI